MKQFVDDHFAVLVVMLVFCLLFGSYMYQIRHQTNTGTIDWLEGELKEIIGAILMGLTGAGAKAALKTPPESPTPPPVVPPQEPK